MIRRDMCCVATDLYWDVSLRRRWEHNTLYLGLQGGNVRRFNHDTSFGLYVRVTYLHCIFFTFCSGQN
jgi:hypothetical protein